MAALLRLLVVEEGCILCGKAVEFMCGVCQQKVCRYCVRYAGDQILCPSCDDNEEE